MRILLVSPIPPSRDGIAAYTARLAESYRRAGHTVGFVAPAGVGGGGSVGGGGVRAGGGVGTGDPGADTAIVAGLSGDPRSWPAVTRAVASWRPDVVHVQHAIATYGPRLGSILALLAFCRARGLRVVVTHHEVTRDTDRLGPIGALYYAGISRLARRVHVHTPAAAQRVLRHRGAPSGRLLTYPHPVFALGEPGPGQPVSPTPPASTGPAADGGAGRAGRGPFTLLLIGYIQLEKGHLEAVEALAALLARRPDLAGRVRLEIAGEVRPRPAGFSRFEEADRAYERRVRGAVERAGLADIVRWTGHVPDADFVDRFRRADLVLLPYAAAEDSGIAGHAVALDAPVLAADVGGLGELFRDTPLLLEGRDPQAFARSLERVLDDPEAHRARCAQVYADVRARRSPAGLVEAVTALAAHP